MKEFSNDLVNPKTGKPFSWDDPNVFSGDPGYILEAGDRGYVPYQGEASDECDSGEMLLADLVHTSANASASPGAIMKYHYNVAPRTGGGFSTQAVLAEAFHEDTVDASVSAVTGLPEQQCAEVLAAYMDQLFMCSAGNRWAHAIHNLLNMLPTPGERIRLDRQACGAR